MRPQNPAFCFVPPSPQKRDLHDSSGATICFSPPGVLTLTSSLYPWSGSHPHLPGGAEANPAIDRKTKRTTLGSVARSDGTGHLDSHSMAHSPPDILGPHFCFWLPKKGLFCLILRDPGPEVGPSCGLNRVSLLNSCVEALTTITSECDVFKDRAFSKMKSLRWALIQCG